MSPCRTPAVNSAERFMLDVHARRPGATARALGRGRTGDGRSSYELLADHVRPGQHVLDLGCGDGFLLELLVARGHAPGSLVGVDLSAHEIAAARRRRALAGVSLACESAMSLSAEDRSFDCVLSHLAFMLVSDLEAAIAELARVLAPGGVFATIVGGGPDGAHPGEAFALFLDLLADATADIPRIAPRLGDPRARDAVGLAPLLCAGGRFDPIDETVLTLRLDGTAAEVWTSLAESYEMSALPAPRVEDLRARFSAEAMRLADASGTVPCAMRLRCLRAARC
jgi:SAM-dependent methyltransferase